MLVSLTSNIADPTGILTSLIYDTLGVDISGDTYLADFESAYNAGKITGDMISVFVSMFEIVQGITEIGGSIAITTAGVAATATGPGAAVGVPAIVVSVEGVAVGVATAGHGAFAMLSSFSNLYDDVQNYNNSKPIKNTYNSIKDSPNYPKGFTERQNGTTKNKVKNQELLDELRKIESGEWKKVYKDGYNSNGDKISIHYFQSKSGKVFDVKVKQGWSN